MNMLVRTSVLAGVLVSTAVATAADAQILNTLRGFQDAERGWSGRVEGTVALADGNTEYLEIELGGHVQFRRGRHRVRVLGGFSRRTASGDEVAESRVGHLRHNYRIRPWLATVAFVQGQHDPFRRIRTRILLGGGARFDLVRSKTASAALGVTAMREEETLTGTEGSSATARLSLFASVFRDVKDGTDVDVTAFYQPALDDPGDARAVVTAGIRADIGAGVYFLVNYSLEYDSNPPPDVHTTDHSVRSGLGVGL